MTSLHITSNPDVKSVFNNYPEKVKEKLLNLSRLVIEVATVTDGITTLEETLKWGEPSYLTKHGSTVRIDWKEKQPDQYAMYFKCTSKLVPSFQLAYGDLFTYETTRAIVFKLDDPVPEKELKQCIKAALTYHKVKKLPMLGLGD